MNADRLWVLASIALLLLAVKGPETFSRKQIAEDRRDGSLWRASSCETELVFRRLCCVYLFDRGERLRKREEERAIKRANKRRRLGKKPLEVDRSGGHEGRVKKHANKRRLEVITTAQDDRHRKRRMQKGRILRIQKHERRKQ